ncbi:ArsR/SmtB family transcription factor [Pectinatus brassicae]|uniref:ArsR family transcriptional regulator n=1 Tax=Pectinatus brassicae TaxID=862415 RepID=A0A840UTL6_9FIRM|nr:metalloregulator ArsR/SmtB family transcription factor [Pectinatus brassicae]MBB5337472.1 ArsR family transcriptional regulator [Pectinatus brassicae]
MSKEFDNKDCDTCEIYHIHHDMVNESKLNLLDNTTTLRLAETFKILGDPTRIKILTLLSDNEMCVCDIAEALQMGQSAISHQLRILRGARLVKFRKEGKEAWYSLDDDHVVVLMNQCLQHISHS